MTRRVQTPDLQRPERLQVVARPTDSFVQPAVPTKSLEAKKLNDIAKSLSQIQPSIRQYMRDEIETITQEEFEAGQRARLKNATNFKEAVETGLIDKTQSPWFMKGYNIQSGKAAGYNYDQALRTAYASSDIRNERDPGTVEAFFSTFRTAWLADNGTDDNDFLDGFAPLMRQAEGNLRSSHSASVAETIKAENLDNVVTDHIETIDRSLQAGIGFDDIALNIESINQTQLFAAGYTRPEINDITLDNIVSLAVERRDPTVLKLAEHIRAGNHSLADRPAARQKLENARAQIASRTAAEFRMNNAMQEEQRRQQKVAISTEALSTLIEDPSADMTPFFERAAVTGSPELVNTLNALQGTVENNATQPDLNAIRSLVVRIRHPDPTMRADEKDVLDAFINGDVNADWERRLRGMVQEARDSDNPINDPEFKHHTSQIRRVLLGDEFTFDRQKDQIEATALLHQFQEDYMDFLEETEGQPTARQKSEFLQERSRFYQWQGASEVTRHRLLRSGLKPPEDFDFDDSLTTLGDDLFLLEPSVYDPSSNAIFKSIDDLGAAIETYNEALRVSPDAARKTFFGKLIIDTGMSPEELMKAQENILKKNQ